MQALAIQFEVHDKDDFADPNPYSKDLNGPDESPMIVIGSHSGSGSQNPLIVTRQSKAGQKQQARPACPSATSITLHPSP